MSRESLRVSPVSDCTNSAVPDFAIVPRFATTSSRLMPIPLSVIETVPASASKSTSILSSGSSSVSAGSASASKRSLSAASDALEISSLRKISRLLYNEWIIR